MEAGDEYIETGGGDVETGFALGTARINDLGGTASTDYYHTDMLGTTRFLTQYTGESTSVIEPAVYTAFGELVSGTSGRFGYVGAHGYQTAASDTPGDPYAADMPYQHVGHRYYDPTTGRFLQRDPIGIEGARNVYEYVESTPTIWVDPEGSQVASPVPPYYAAGGAAAAREAAETALFVACAMGGGEWARRNVRKPGSRVGDGVDIPIKGHPQAPKYKEPKPGGKGVGHSRSFPLIAIVIVLILWSIRSVFLRRQVTA